MPHDRKKNLLAVGDRVFIPARITSLQTGDDYCNLGLETEEPMRPSDTKTTLCLNAGQVEKWPDGVEGNPPPQGPGDPH